MRRESIVKIKRAEHCRNVKNGSLILVLIISAFSLIVVLALITLSSLNINMIRSQIENTQARMTAHAIIDHMLYELDTYTQERNNNYDISSASASTDIKTRYNQFPIYLSERNYYQGSATITFAENSEYYSTDNFASENPAHGWRDKGKDTMSVPPFSIDFWVNVKIGGSELHYEAIINRIWPYAAFCNRGSLIVTTQVNSSSLSYFKPYPSHIKGNILSFSSVCLGLPDTQDKDNYIIGNICTSLPKPQQICSNIDPIYINDENILAGSKQYNVTECKNLFETIKIPDKKTFFELLPHSISEIEDIDNIFTSLSLSSSNLQGSKNNGSLIWAYSDEKFNKYNLLVDKYISLAHSKPELIPEDMKRFIDDFKLRILDSNPYADESEIMCNAIKYYVQKTYFGSILFMKKNLVLQGTDGHNKFYIKGNLTNHLSRTSYKMKMNNSNEIVDNNIWIKDDDIYSKAGLILKDCSLYVDGDIELLEYNLNDSAIPITSSDGETALSIKGDNATLIVSGNMRIIGGSLDSKDKGMVMLAKNIEFSSKGNYKGIILSKGAILINPYPGTFSTTDRLHINGAIACRGMALKENCEEGSSTAIPGVPEGLTLKSVDLNLNHRYTKALHQFGKAKVVYWQELR